MKPIAVDSTSLATIAYNTNLRSLRICFRDQTVYQYRDVPADVYEALMGAPSKGIYFNRAVRDRFPHVLISDSLS
jgi:hypothetical protein